MGSSCLILCLTLTVFLSGASAQVYQNPYQGYPGYQGYPSYYQQPYPQLYQQQYTPLYQQPYQQLYQQPYQQLYQQPYQQSYQQPYQQYAVPYGYPQYQQSGFEGTQNNYAYPYVYSNYPGYQNTYPSYPQINQNYTKPTTQNETNSTNATNTTSTTASTTPDPFADVKVEIIDVDPQYFNYLMRYHNLQPQIQVQPYQAVRGRPQYRPSYNITVGTNQSNYTSVPQTITKHDVQHKTFTFKKTYVITPENRNQKINLNFVNGVPVTDTAEAYKEGATEPYPITDSEPVTTTEDENPVTVTKKGRRFIDVPASCPEGTQLVEGVGCFKKFSLAVDPPTEEETTSSTN